MRSQLNKFISRMKCAQCGSRVRMARNGEVKCVACGAFFPIRDNAIYFYSDGHVESKEDQGRLFARLKEIVKKAPRLYYVVTHFFGASMTGVSTKKFFRSNFSSEHLVLNIGAGVKNIDDHILNVDISPYGRVDIVASMFALPFQDESVDGILCEDVLEHVENPPAAMSEMYRVLKPGGKIYVSAPFIFQYHKSPEDYYRWTLPGLRQLAYQFKERASGPRHGPTSALALMIIYWVALVCSFGVGILYEILYIALTVVLAPWCHIADFFLARLPTASVMAAGFFFIGEKPRS